MEILLVEDYDSDRRLFRSLVNQHNQSLRDGYADYWRLTTKEDLESTIVFLSALPPTGKPDIAVVDLTLQSGQDGLTVVKYLCETHRSLAVVVWSQSASAETWREIAEAGAMDFISKNRTLTHWELERHLRFAFYNKRDADSLMNLLNQLRETFDTRASSFCHETCSCIEKIETLLANGQVEDAQTWLRTVKEDLSRFLIAYTAQRSDRLQIDSLKVSEICTRVIDEHALFWRSRFQKIEVKVKSFIDPSQDILIADNSKISIILRNVLENAVKVQVESQVAIEVRYHITREPGVLWGEITVRDFGTGPSAFLLEGGFKHGVTPPDGRHPPGGWGVGLHTSYAIARQHTCKEYTGDLDVLSSDDGIGTVVRLRIPFEPPDEEG